MTDYTIKYHISFIKNMSAYDIKSFLRYAHKDHIYFTMDILNDIFKIQMKKVK